MEPENREILLRGAEAFGIDLAEGAILAFDIYLRELLKWNQKINLTAIRTEKGVVIKHFLDSLSVCSHIPGHTSLLDVGSGAGFPGIPLKMVQSVPSGHPDRLGSEEGRLSEAYCSPSGPERH